MRIRHSVMSGVAAALLAGCAPAAESPAAKAIAEEAAAAEPADTARATAAASSASETANHTAAQAATAAPSALPVVRVHKSPTCACCTGWVEHLRQAGFTVTVDAREDLSALKQQLGIPDGKTSCHTAEVDGLVIEGHVPAADIQRLLANRGDARGLVLPGMPVGSPGMEAPDGRVQPYTVERLESDGRTSPFASHGEAN
jgi:hypothetical protein